MAFFKINQFEREKHIEEKAKYWNRNITCFADSRLMLCAKDVEFEDHNWTRNCFFSHQRYPFVSGKSFVQTNIGMVRLNILKVASKHGPRI